MLVDHVMQFERMVIPSDNTFKSVEKPAYPSLSTIHVTQDSGVIDVVVNKIRNGYTNNFKIAGRGAGKMATAWNYLTIFPLTKSRAISS